MQFEAFPLVFNGIYHMDLGIGSLPFLGFLVTGIITVRTNVLTLIDLIFILFQQFIVYCLYCMFAIFHGLGVFLTT